MYCAEKAAGRFYHAHGTIQRGVVSHRYLRVPKKVQGTGRFLIYLVPKTAPGTGPELLMSSYDTSSYE